MKYYISCALVCLVSLPLWAATPTDDCTPIRKAIASASEGNSVVIVPNGTYVCKTPIILDHDHVTLRGDGKATLRLANGANSPLIIMGDAQTPPRPTNDIQVYDLTLDGNKEHQTMECWGSDECDQGGTTYVRNNGITVRGLTNGHVENVVIHDARSGGIVTERGTYYLTVVGLTSSHNYYDALAGYQTYHSKFSKLVLENNHSAGVSIDIDFSDNVIENAIIRNNGDVGIFMRDSNRNVFKNVKITDNSNHGVFLASSSSDKDDCANDNEFNHLVVMNSKGSGFRLNNKCLGNKLTKAAHFIGNRDKCVSEAENAKLDVQGSVFCSEN